MNTSRKALWLLLLGSVVHALVYRPLLPLRVASHFDGAGVPNGWMARDAFLWTYIGLVVFLTVTFAGIGLLLRRVPVEMVNLPNREYWMAPERREQTIGRLESDMSGFAIATNLLMVAIMHLTFQANLMPAPHLGSLSLTFLVAYLGYTLVWTVGLFRRYGAIPR